MKKAPNEPLAVDAIATSKKIYYKPTGHQRGKTTVPAEHVLDMRRRSEILRQPFSEIKEAYPQYSIQYVRGILGYEIRANLRVESNK